MISHGITVRWSLQCAFVFRSFTTQTVGAFMAGCILTFLLCLLISYLPHLRDNIKNFLFPLRINAEQVIAKEQLTIEEKILKHGIIPAVYGFTKSILYLAIMLILMQLNGYVLIFIILGYTAGFVLFNQSPNGEQQKTVECH